MARPRNAHSRPRGCYMVARGGSNDACLYIYDYRIIMIPSVWEKVAQCIIRSHWHCITSFLAVRLDSPPTHSASAHSTPLIMEFSQDEVRTAGDWPLPARSVRRGLGCRWVGMSAWEGESFWPVFDSLGSEKMTRLTKIPVSPYPISRRLASRRHAAQRNRRRNCSIVCPRRRNCLRTVPAGPTTGSKRRIGETSFCHSIERLFCSRHSEGPPKKLRQLRHQIHHNWHDAYSSDSNIRKSRPNSTGKDSDNPRTNASKSCEGNSQYLRFRSTSVMRMPSDLHCLLGNGGWSSFASTNVRKPCVAFGLRLNRCFRVKEQSLSAEASLVEVISTRGTPTGWDSVPNDLREHIIGSRRVRRCRKRQQSVPSKKPTTTTWDSLPNDLQLNVLQKVDFRDLFRFKTSSKSSKKIIESEAFRQSRGGISEGVFTAINYYIKKNSWRCSGYDLHSRSWRSFPTVSYLPPPDAELFKEYSVCGHGGLMCAEVSKLPAKGELVVFNPLTGETRALPPLLHPRNPVLVHISVDSAKKSYKVVVAGSSAASDEHLSRKVEVFDSSTSKWIEVCDLPGPAFGLNEHRAGVFLNGKLFFISFLEGGGRVVVAFDVENGTWLATPIPWSSYSNTLQLVESDGKLFVFSEQEPDQSVNHCIDELEFLNLKAGVLTCRWRKVVKAKKSGGRRLGFGEGKLGIFNHLSKKLLYVLLSSCFANPTGACAEDQSMDSPSSMRIAWESPDFAKKAAVTLLVGLTLIGARVVWGIFLRRQAPGDQIDIMQVLEDSPSDIGTNRESLSAILPEIR